MAARTARFEVARAATPSTASCSGPRPALPPCAAPAVQGAHLRPAIEAAQRCIRAIRSQRSCRRASWVAPCELGGALQVGWRPAVSGIRSSTGHC